MDIKNIDKAIDIAHETVDIAKGIVKPSSENIGNALGVFTGFFSNVVLYPLKRLNIKFEFKAKEFERRLDVRNGVRVR